MVHNDVVKGVLRMTGREAMEALGKLFLRQSDDEVCANHEQCDGVTCPYSPYCKVLAVDMPLKTPPAVPITMRLSDAIRLGSTLDAQAERMIFETDASTALGAALIAAYGERAILYAISDLGATFPVAAFEATCPVVDCHLLERRPKCPLLQSKLTVAVICDHLEGAHAWSRWRVADWVRSVEEAQLGILGDRTAGRRALE
jgi:hypothetical protein